MKKDSLFFRGYLQLLKGKGKLLFSIENQVIRTLVPTEKLSYFEFSANDLTPGSTLRIILSKDSGNETLLKFQARVS